MSTILKSYRLPQIIIDFLARKAKETGQSEAAVLKQLILKKMKRENQWRKDLALMGQDLDYQQEQIKLAEEQYED